MIDLFRGKSITFHVLRYSSHHPSFLELHWLPVKYRIEYKIATFTFRHFKNTLPPYLSSLLSAYEPSCSLRSSNEWLFLAPRTNTNIFGQRSFRFQAPIVCISIPSHIYTHSALNPLKIHLLKKSFLHLKTPHFNLLSLE